MTELDNNQKESKGIFAVLINFLPNWMKYTVVLILIISGALLVGYVYYKNNIKEDMKVERKIEEQKTEKSKLENDTVKSNVTVIINKTEKKSKINQNHYESKDKSKQVNVDENIGTINVN